MQFKKGKLYKMTASCAVDYVDFEEIVNKKIDNLNQRRVYKDKTALFFIEEIERSIDSSYMLSRDDSEKGFVFLLGDHTVYLPWHDSHLMVPFND